MTYVRSSAAICILLLAAFPAQADDTTAAISKAQAQYRQGSLAKSFAHLEEATTLVVRQLAERYTKTFPPAPQGWSAEPAQYATKGKYRIGRGFVVSRNYFQDKGRGVATVQVNIDQQGLIEASGALLTAERHAKAVRRQLVSIKGAGNAFVKFDKSRGTGNLYIFVAGRFYIRVSVQKVESQTFLTKLLSNYDFAGLRKIAGMN